MAPLDLSGHVVLDCTTGTFFNAAHAVIIDVSALTPEQLETLNEGSDFDRTSLPWDDEDGLLPFAEDLEEWSRPADMLANGQALDSVAALLNAEQWSSDHIEAVADIVRSTGREIKDV
jgi:hypothetical protein